MSFLILVVDDESDVEDLFRQQFRHDLRAGRFTMDFAQSGDGALQRISDAATMETPSSARCVRFTDRISQPAILKPRSSAKFCSN